MLPSTIATTDYHTGGEPFRIVAEPPVPIPGSTVAERRARAIDDPGVQGLRAVLCSEPRGHADMYGGFVVPPDVVVCATSARTPLFDSSVLRGDVVVVAVGSHEPDARELDAPLLARAAVVVEDVATALREAGDVVMAIPEGALTAADLVPMRDVLTAAVAVPADRPLVFKSVGMAWQDLVVAAAVVGLTESRAPASPR